MIKMLIQLLHWKIRLTTNLAYWPSIVTYFLQATTITVVFVFFGDFFESIASKMEACIALITVKHLI